MAFSRSLVPQMFRPTSDWWDLWDFPPRIFDQNFGVGLNDDDLLPLTTSPFWARPLIRRQLSQHSSSTTSTSTSTGQQQKQQQLVRGASEVSNSSNQFSVSLDVSQFAPNEITVKAVDNNCVIIEGKHEERPDEHGYISRNFTRRYMLPKGIEAEKIASSLSPEGILTVSVPKTPALEEGKPKEKVIPITFGASPVIVDSTVNILAGAAEQQQQSEKPQPQPQSQPQQQQQQQQQPQTQGAQVVQQPEQQTVPESPAVAPASAPTPVDVAAQAPVATPVPAPATDAPASEAAM